MKTTLTLIIALCSWVSVLADVRYTDNFSYQTILGSDTPKVILIRRGKTKLDTTQVKSTSFYVKQPKNDTVVLILKTGAKYKISASTVKYTPDQYTWFKRISIVKSFDNATDKAAAATLNLVYPKDSVSSQNFAFAIGYNVLPNAFHNPTLNMQLNPFFEWQKNTLSSKKQNVITSGLNFQISIPKFNANDRFQMFGVASLNYKNDRIKSSEGTQANLYLSPIFDGSGDKFYFKPDARMKNPAIEIIYNVFGGVEYENVNTAKKAEDKGTVYRLYGRFVATFSPIPDILDERLQFVPDFTYRSGFSNSIASEKKTNKLWKYDINLVIIKQKDSGFGDVSVGYDFQKGVDPTAGYEDQTVRTIALKIKIIPGKKS
ncbi:hypothetical protein [Mucilaginibacter psychrotolerans]|uniref:DUF3078 domain-containing protein n=1 Tax=Mucilaginibacter psychrotolerans TaxID=1524096 RepID=A0A4Y8RYX2_9SPHI|nr:hypothetical protein [Mucilaginibacter psychrotolerans]TFF29723.1 hypothetical protein E2R66_28030 [Mucilaginibacter psychrotolerans]